MNVNSNRQAYASWPPKDRISCLTLALTRAFHFVVHALKMSLSPRKNKEMEKKNERQRIETINYTVRVTLCLIKHYAMNMYGGVEV
jgi:hypothetical protein